MAKLKKPLSDPDGCSGDILAIQDAIDVFSGKWRILIIHYLMYRKDDINTFKKMEKDISGISAKMLSKELKILETNKMVLREEQSTKPITVKYSITDYGMSCKEVISALVKWGVKHRIEMMVK